MKKIKFNPGDSVYYKYPEGNEHLVTIKHTQSWNKEYDYKLMKVLDEKDQ